jgi:hypothetical protein
VTKPSTSGCLVRSERSETTVASGAQNFFDAGMRIVAKVMTKGQNENHMPVAFSVE